MLDRFSEFLRFGGVGILSTAIHALAYLTALMALTPQPANAFGFVCAVTVSWYGHRFFTFREARNAPMRRSVSRFAITALTGYGLNAAFVLLTSSVLEQPPAFAVLFIAFVTPVVTYLALRYWVFETEENGS